jgi:hypothetical protein
MHVSFLLPTLELEEEEDEEEEEACPLRTFFVVAEASLA